MNAPHRAPRPLSPRDLARDAAGLLGDCRDTYPWDGEIAVVLTTAIRALQDLAVQRARRRRRPEASR